MFGSALANKNTLNDNNLKYTTTYITDSQAFTFLPFLPSFFPASLFPDLVAIGFCC